VAGPLFASLEGLQRGLISKYQKIEGFLRPFYRKTPNKSSYRHIIGVVFAGLDAITGYNLREISARPENTKHEIRNSKQYRMFKIRILKKVTPAMGKKLF
jgi:hypothetical protein